MPRLTPHVGFGLVPYAEHDLSTSITCIILVYLSFRSLLFSIFHCWTHLGQWTFKILLRHVGRKLMSLFSSTFVILHIVPKCHRIAMMFDMKILILVSWRSSPVLQTFESPWKTILALSYLATLDVLFSATQVVSNGHWTTKLSLSSTSVPVIFMQSCLLALGLLKQLHFVNVFLQPCTFTVASQFV